MTKTPITAAYLVQIGFVVRASVLGENKGIIGFAKEIGPVILVAEMWRDISGKYTAFWTVENKPDFRPKSLDGIIPSWMTPHTCEAVDLLIQYVKELCS